MKERIKTILDDDLKNFNYNPADVNGNSLKANAIAVKIRDSIQKSGTVRRYKINVQCFLGEKKNQRVCIVAKGWWDNYTDNYATYTYQGDYFYCTCIVWGMYTD
jgi:hypothetical protein